MGITGNSGTCKPAVLDFPCPVDPFPDSGRGFAFLSGRKLVKIHRWNFHMNIQTIQQRPGNPPQIAGDCTRRTGTGSGGVTKITAGTGVHGSYQHHSAGIRNGAVYPGDGHLSVLNRLPEDLHSSTGKFRQFIEKQNPVMRKGDFPRSWNAPATGKACRRNGMMWGTEGVGYAPAFRLLAGYRQWNEFLWFQSFLQRSYPAKW